MSEMKHTPGPWFGRPHHNPVGICGCDEVGLQIAFITSASEERRDEFKANARLIAAAPELLEALRVLVDRDFTYFDGAVIGAATKITRDEVLAARAAIAKATRKTP